jgi:peptidoglycan/LPS O-acetylase OafA/YrhL
MNRERGKSTDRMPGLDLLRATAILWVMYYHAVVFHFVASSNLVERSGWMGVDLFFALSGFLIANQLFRPLAHGQQIDIGSFYARRLLRTWPPYMAAVALYFTFPIVRESSQIAPLWRFLTFTQNLFNNAQHAMAFSHAWSLCVEEQFYLIAPLMVWMLSRQPSPRKTVIACASILLGGIILRAAIWEFALAPVIGSRQQLIWHWMDLIYRPTWTRLDGLLAGVLLALIRNFRPKVWQALMNRGDAILVAALGVSALAICIFGDQVNFIPSVIGFPILAIAFGGLVAAGASPMTLIGRRAVPGAGFVAAMAYSLYLTHKSVYHLVGLVTGDSLKPHLLLSIALYGGTAMIVGAIFYAGIERTSLRLRDRALKRRVVASPPLLAAERLS